MSDKRHLVAHFIQRHATRAGKRVRGIAPDALAALVDAPWPGNVRELENAVERAVVLCAGPVIEVRDVLVPGPRIPTASTLPSGNLRQNLEWTEKETVRKALDTSKGVKKDAAELMGISQRAMSYYLAKHHID